MCAPSSKYAGGTWRGRKRARGTYTLVAPNELVVAAQFELKPILILGRRIPGNALPFGRLFGPQTDKRLVFGAGFPKHHHGAKRLGVHTRDQVNVPGVVFLPQLAYLDFLYAHLALNDSRDHPESC